MDQPLSLQDPAICAASSCANPAIIVWKGVGLCSDHFDAILARLDELGIEHLKDFQGEVLDLLG